MEHIIAREGDDQITLNFIMELGAMKFDEEAEYPVTWNFDKTRPPIGKATNVHRDEEGHIVADIEIFDEALRGDLKPPTFGFYSLSDDLELDPDEGIQRIVKSTTLRSVGCVLESGFPKED